MSKKDFSFSKEFACLVGFTRLGAFEGYLLDYPNSGKVIRQKYNESIADTACVALACVESDKINPATYVRKPTTAGPSIQEMIKNKLPDVRKIIAANELIDLTETDDEEEEDTLENLTQADPEPKPEPKPKPEDPRIKTLELELAKKNELINKLQSDFIAKEKHYNETFVALQNTKSKFKEADTYYKNQISVHKEKLQQLTAQNYKLTEELNFYTPFKHLIEEFGKAFTRKRNRSE